MSQLKALLISISALMEKRKALQNPYFATRLKNEDWNDQEIIELLEAENKLLLLFNDLSSMSTKERHDCKWFIN